jgi:hypothetical protein
MDMSNQILGVIVEVTSMSLTENDSHEELH